MSGQLGQLGQLGKTGQTTIRALLISLLALSVLPGCELRSKAVPITVYSPSLSVSFPLPQGWTADEAIEQAGFHMQTFTGASVDVPERPGIRVQVMAGPTPEMPLEQVATRYRRELELEREEDYSFAGSSGKIWFFVSADGEERSRLALVDVSGTLYGLFVRGEAPTVAAYGDDLDRMFRDFSLEKREYLAAYQAPSGDVVIRHPRSWEMTPTASSPESLFVGFRSPPLAVEKDGTTVHATLEVSVNRVPPDFTVERFYAERSETIADTYRLLEHEALAEEGAISTLYQVETQLSQYLERTVYVVRDGKSFIYKFNCRNRVYYAIEPWIDEIVKSFFEPAPAGTAKETRKTDADPS
jgi:hypothetical protein